MIKKAKNIYHRALSFLGAFLYRFPSREIIVVGVTGTKGKTTVLELINAGLQEAGRKTAVMSSIRRKVGEEDAPQDGNSMPGRFALHRFLREAVRRRCEYALIEVTSEGVAQHRHRNIDFDAGVFINLHPEHIESHGSFEKYRKAKTDFFRYIAEHSRKPRKYFFINRDDENASYFIDAAGEGEKTLFSKSGLKSGLEGEFNKWNIGAAEAVLKTLGVSEDKIKSAFENFSGVPGRIEFIQREPFAVVVDYAHTPDSLRQVYETLQSANSESNLICVLGSAGGGAKQGGLKIGSIGSRDKWKRPKFGEVASTYCREIILTDEDPWDEDPSQILEEIESGIPKSKSYAKILDRREAIGKAIGLAGPGDTVVITGKGSERHIRVAGGKKIPWSDKEVVKEILGERR